MSTVEAIQAFLPGLGWILVPADYGFAPNYINDEWIYYEQPRVFDEPNELGKKYKYVHSEATKRYYCITCGGLHER